MADYHQLKNAAILTPTTNTDLGSDANRYSNVFMSGNIVMSNGVTVTSTNVITPKIASITYPGNDTAADIAGGQTITITGTGFSAGASVLLGTTPATVVTVISSTSITFTSPVLSAGNYALYVINSDGGTAIYIPGIAFSGTPTWSTSSGNIASAYETNSISSTVAATGDATISYSLNSGTLPTGSTLNSSTGLISGTAPASAGSTTYSFTIRATDGQNQDTDRNFTITVNTDSVSWSSPADNTSTALDQGAAMSTFTMSASSAAGKSITYSANTLPTGLSISTNTIVGTPTVTGSTTSLITATAANSGRTATRTLSWVVSVAAETYWPYVTLLLNGEGTAATNNAQNNTYVDTSTNAYAVTTSGTPVQGSFSPFSATSWSNYFDGTGDYLTAPASTAWNFTGDWTFECWVYPTAITGYHTFLGQWGNPDNIFIWKMNSSGRMYLENLGAAITATSTTILANQWQHIALTRSSNTIRMFVNGVLDATTATRSGTYYSSGAMYVGAGYGEVFNGFINSMRILKGTALYTTTFTPPTAPLTAIANTSLLTCQSNRFKDNSTNALAITKYGDTSVTKFTPFNGTNSYDPSTYGGSVYLDGSSSLQIASGSLLNVSASANWTLECWVYFTTVGGAYQHIFFGSGLSFGLYGATFYVTNNAAGLINGGSAVAGQWYHLALVNIASTSYKIYLNGVEIATGGASGFTATATGLGGSTTNTAGITGYLSDMRIVRGTAVYTGSFTPPTAPLTAIANTALLINATNAGVIDQTGQNNLRTLGDAKISTAVKKYNSGSIAFDGTGDYLTTPNNNRLQFGTGQFTVEFWMNTADTTANIMGLTGSAAAGYWNIMISSGLIYWQTAYALTNGLSYSISSYTNTWTHYAFVRTADNNLKLYINGTEKATASNTTNYNGTAGDLVIGYSVDYDPLVGYIDDLRITKGYARYTTTFTAPTSAFSTK